MKVKELIEILGQQPVDADITVWIDGERLGLIDQHGVVVAAFVDVDARKIGRLVHGAPVHPTAWLAARPERAVVVAAVGTSGARAVVRAFLADSGVVEGEDGVVVA